MGIFYNSTLSYNQGVTFASGGTVTEITQNGVVYRVHSFTTVGVSTFTVNRQLKRVEYLVVAGGGGGGFRGAGGGGAGGLLYDLSVISASSYTVTVGNGGAAPSAGNGYIAQNGENSSISGITTAIGGGRGGSGGSPYYAGGNGGSGGGASYDGGTGSGTIGQGNNGGNGVISVNPQSYSGGGGGGAGGVGSNATTTGQLWGSGGVGLSYDISGQSIVYSTGGNGNNHLPTISANHPTTLSNLGNGGHGGTTRPGGNPGRPGGSGIVIIRYPIGVVGQ